LPVAMGMERLEGATVWANGRSHWETTCGAFFRVPWCAGASAQTLLKERDLLKQAADTALKYSASISAVITNERSHAGKQFVLYPFGAGAISGLHVEKGFLR
jgi:hypothetical protein